MSAFGPLPPSSGLYMTAMRWLARSSPLRAAKKCRTPRLPCGASCRKSRFAQRAALKWSWLPARTTTTAQSVGGRKGEGMRWYLCRSLHWDGILVDAFWVDMGGEYCQGDQMYTVSPPVLPQ